MAAPPPSTSEWIPRLPTITRQCQKCWVFEKAPDILLKSCSGCKSCHYCSPECQQADWSRHKTDCKRQQKLRAHWKEKDKVEPPLPVSGISRSAMQDRFKKWRQCHKDLFHWSVGEALTLDRTPERIATHGLVMIVKPNPSASESTHPGRCFDLLSAFVKPIDEMRDMCSGVADSKQMFDDILGSRSEELRKRGGLGWAVILMTLFDHEGRVPDEVVPHILPMGFMKKADVSDDNWYQTLFFAVHNGKY